MLDLSYRIFRNSLGVVDALNRSPDGATVPIWDEGDPLTIELRQWEKINGVLDLSAHAVEPQIMVEKQDYLGFYGGLLSEAINLFLYVRHISDLDLPVSNCYTDLMGSIQFGQFAGFQASISNLFAAMKASGHEFSEAQTVQMRTLLDVHGFKAISIPMG